MEGDSIHVVCDACGESFPVLPVMRGQSVICPECGRKLEVPSGSGSESSDVPDMDALRKGLQTRHKCPACKAFLHEDDVICVKCGYNLQSGDRLHTETEPGRRFSWGKLPVYLLIAAALAAAWYYYRYLYPR